MSQLRTFLTSGSVPNINQLHVGDIGINSYDGKAYIKKLQGNVQSVVEIGGGAAVSASYALSASFASTAATASYFSGSITNAVSASYAITASYAFNATSASYASTASYALNASDILVLVKNQSGNNILKGMVVRITGSNNSSDIPRVVTASYENDNNSANTLGIANENITNGSEGFVMTEGVLLGINTSNYISGQLIYLGATGSITGSAPLAPLHNVRLGEVIRHQSNNGSIYVRIDNGYEIGELHDVRDTTTTGSYGDLLVKSGSIWINSKSLTGSYSITGSLVISGSSTFTNIGPAIFSGSITGTSGFTGSLSGTSSFAISSSRAVSSSYSVSSSYATNANYASSTPVVPSTLFIQGYLTGDQSIPNSTDTVINFERQYDPNSWLDIGTRRFTPTTAGYYLVSFGAWLENPASSTNQVNVQIRKSVGGGPTSTVMILQQPLNNGTGISLSGTRILYMDGALDYLDFTIFQGSGAPRNLLYGGTPDGAGTWFSAHLITM